jgi:hypothetical protein
MVLAGTEPSGQGSLSGISIIKNAPSQTSLSTANTSLDDRAVYLNSDLSALSRQLSLILRSYAILGSD